MRALLLVDIQYDFMPGGPLAAPEGDQVIPVANRMQGDFPLVVATQDWHPPGHASFAANHEAKEPGDRIDLDGLEQVLWPAHCLRGTRGAALHEDLDTTRVAAIFRKGRDPRVDSYSGFFDNGRRRATGLHGYLEEKEVDEVVVVGLATDYCVKLTALDAASLGYRTSVVLEACRGVDLEPGDVERAIGEMREAGVDVQ